MSKTTVTATLSSDGQVNLPKDVLDGRRWGAGTKLVVEETNEGILLRKAAIFPPTRFEDVAGMLKYDGPPKTIEEMNEGVLKEARRRFERTRY